MPPTLPAIFIIPPTVATRERGASKGGNVQYILPHIKTNAAQDSKIIDVFTSGILGNKANDISVQIPDTVNRNLHDLACPNPLLASLSASHPPQRLPQPPAQKTIIVANPTAFKSRINARVRYPGPHVNKPKKHIAHEQRPRSMPMKERSGITFNKGSLFSSTVSCTTRSRLMIPSSLLFTLGESSGLSRITQYAISPRVIAAMPQIMKVIRHDVKYNIISATNIPPIAAPNFIFVKPDCIQSGSRRKYRCFTCTKQ